MNIVTRDFGELDITQNEIITFPNGLFAFENEHEFILLSPLGQNIYPMWLQAVNNQDLCLIVFNPLDFDPNYHVSVDKTDLECVEIDAQDIIDYLVIAVIPQDIKDSVVNLKAPIVINSTKNKAVQVIAAEDYPIKHPAFAKEES